MIKMEKRVKVILHRRDGWSDDHKLALTADQVKLMRWMLDTETVDVDVWELQVLDEAEEWEEI